MQQQSFSYTAVYSNGLGDTMQGHTSWVYSAAISEDGQPIVPRSAENTVRQWHAHSELAMGEVLEGEQGLDVFSLGQI